MHNNGLLLVDDRETFDLDVSHVLPILAPVVAFFPPVCSYAPSASPSKPMTRIRYSLGYPSTC